MELVDFFTLYGIINLGIHLSMFLTSLNMSRRDYNDLESESSEHESESSEPESDSEPGDPSYVPQSDFKMNLRKRKTI
jgi:hypothetical protein